MELAILAMMCWWLDHVGIKRKMLNFKLPKYILFHTIYENVYGK
jgi:hypothetical protein